MFQVLTGTAAVVRDSIDQAVVVVIIGPLDSSTCISQVCLFLGKLKALTYAFVKAYTCTTCQTTGNPMQTESKTNLCRVFRVVTNP